MRKVLSIPFVSALLCAAAAALSTGPALATAPGGTLTKVEYRQVHAWLADEAIFDKKGNLKDAGAGCSALSSSTALVQTLQSSCIADVTVYTEFLTVRLAQQECDQAATDTTTATSTTTTTGTTTTPTSGGLTSAQLLEYVCLRPLYEYVARNASSMYAADRAARRTAVARGLSRQCLNTIVATGAQLRDEKNMEAAEQHAIADDAVLAKLENGEVPSSAARGDRVRADLSAYERAFRKFAADETPDKLSTCAHA